MRGGYGGYQPRGRGGPYQGGRGGYNPMMGGRDNGFGPKVPGEGYVCKRCQEKGHFIYDCPKNNDKDYDPSNQKGIPLAEKWKIETLCPEDFSKEMDKTMESLVKHIGLYQQDDTASKNFNPSAGNLNRYPPSLMCQLCKGLMVQASMTPCCQISCCFECVKAKVIESLVDEAENQEKEQGQKSKCPLCSNHELDIQKIIPNKQMRNIIAWFQKQRAYRAKIFTIDLRSKKDKEGANAAEDDDRSRSSSEEFNEHKLQTQIDTLVSDYKQREQIELQQFQMLEKQQKELAEAQQIINEAHISQMENKDLEADALNNGDDQPKFDKNIHVGTRYDPNKGIRVPVTNQDQLPKLKTHADQIMELQKYKLEQQRQMDQYRQQMMTNPQNPQNQSAALPFHQGNQLAFTQQAPIQASSNITDLPFQAKIEAPVDHIESKVEQPESPLDKSQQSKTSKQSGQNNYGDQKYKLSEVDDQVKDEFKRRRSRSRDGRDKKRQSSRDRDQRDKSRDRRDRDRKDRRDRDRDRERDRERDKKNSSGNKRFGGRR